MSKDISKVLENWEFSGNPHLVRRILGKDGREVIQRRIDLGILQLEVEGRPDGTRPHGFESYLAYYQHQAREKERLPGEEPFRLSTEACEKLQIEALLYYQRRLCYFELKDYAGAAKDARRNLEVFEIVRKYADQEEDVLAMDQFRAFVIFHRVKAEVLGSLEKKEYDFALKYIEAAEREIRSFYEEYDRGDVMDEGEEMAQLNQWRQQILKLRPKSRQQILESELKDAVEREEYERAARIRDELHQINGGKKNSDPRPSRDQ